MIYENAKVVDWIFSKCITGDLHIRPTVLPYRRFEFGHKDGRDQFRLVLTRVKIPA